MYSLRWEARARARATSSAQKAEGRRQKRDLHGVGWGMKGGKEDEENEEGRMQWHDGTATAAKQAEEAPLSNLGGE